MRRHFCPKQQLTKREELSFLTVLAFPKASSSGLALMIWSSSVPCRMIIIAGYPLQKSCQDQRKTLVPAFLIYLHFACCLLLLLLISTRCNCCKVLDDTLCVHSLPCSGFSAVKPKREAESVWSGGRSPSTGQPHRDPRRGVHTWSGSTGSHDLWKRQKQIDFLNEEHKKTEN